MSEDAGIEPRTVATLALAVRRSNTSAKPHPPRLNLIHDVIVPILAMLVYFLYEVKSPTGWRAKNQTWDLPLAGRHNGKLAVRLGLARVNLVRLFYMDVATIFKDY